jgi:hypothetical protein
MWTIGLLKAVVTQILLSNIAIRANVKLILVLPTDIVQSELSAKVMWLVEGKVNHYMFPTSDLEGCLFPT